MAESGQNMSDVVAAQFVARGQKIFGHASVFVAGNLFLVVAGLLFKVYVARTIGASALGIFGLGMTVVNFFALVALMGFPTVVARFIPTYLARGERSRVRSLIIQSTVFICLAVAVGGLVMVSLTSWISLQVYREPLLAVYLPVFVFILAATVLTDFFGEALRGYQEVARRTVVTTFFRFLLKASVTCSLFLAGWKLWGYIIGDVVALGLVAILLGYYVWKFTPKEPASGLSSAPVFDREVLIFGGSILGLNWLNFLYQNVDKVLLGIFLTATDVGIYALAVAIAAYLPTCLKAVNSILGPTIAELHARGEAALLGRIFIVSTKWMLSLTWPIATVTVFYSEPIMSLFGDEFRAGAMVLALLAVGEIVNVAAGSVGNLLVMSGNQKMEIAARCLNVGVTLPLYLILIPAMGIVGAALSFAVGNVLMNIARVCFVSSRLKLRAYGFDFIRVIPALLASCLSLLILDGWLRSFGGLQTLILASLTAYSVLIVAVFFGGLSKDDKALFTSALQSVRQFRIRGATPSQA